MPTSFGIISVELECSSDPVVDVGQGQLATRSSQDCHADHVSITIGRLNAIVLNRGHILGLWNVNQVIIEALLGLCFLERSIVCGNGLGIRALERSSSQLGWIGKVGEVVRQRHWHGEVLLLEVMVAQVKGAVHWLRSHWWCRHQRL